MIFEGWWLRRLACSSARMIRGWNQFDSYYTWQGFGWDSVEPDIFITGWLTNRTVLPSRRMENLFRSELYFIAFGLYWTRPCRVKYLKHHYFVPLLYRACSVKRNITATYGLRRKFITLPYQIINMSTMTWHCHWDSHFVPKTSALTRISWSIFWRHKNSSDLLTQCPLVLKALLPWLFT